MSGSTEFPASWSDERILHETSDIATDSTQKWTLPGQYGYIANTKMVDGVNIKVVYDPVNNRIVMA
jgi:filamentous hemagglutinin